MNYEVVKKVVKRNKDEYDFVGTCFFVDKKIACTAKHVINKPGELYIEYSLNKHVKFEIDADSVHDIALLLVEEEIECEEYFILDITKSLQGEAWATYGYPNTKLEGESIAGYVSIPNTSVGELYDIDLRMKDNPDLRNYSGLSGSPVLIDGSVKAILVWKPDGNSFGGVKISNFKGLLEKRSIKYKEKYSSWINKVANIGLENDEKFIIERNKLMSNLEEFALGGHGLIIGNPGSGKTYSLKQLHNILNRRGITSLYIAIDNFTSVSNHEFEEEFFLKTGDNLISKLEQELNRIQNNNSKGVIIFDSFDSARDESVKHKFLILMKKMKNTIGDKVNIIASCRSYDARISTGLQEIFPTSAHANNIHCRHFLIDELEETEVISALDKLGVDATHYRTFSKEFMALLRNPFNLWLFEQCGENTKLINEMGKLNSEIQLLDLFWDKRISGSDMEISEKILHKITNLMLNNRSLSIKKRDVFKSEYQKAWNRLLSNGIISYSDSMKSKVSFSHNILFDYAVAKLVLIDQLEEFTSFIEDDTSRLIFMRPSLMYFLSYIWVNERSFFWKITFDVMSSDRLPTVTKFIIVNTIVTHAKEVQDLEILLIKSENRDKNCLIQYILQAVSIFKVIEEPIWLDFICELYKTIEDDLLGVLSFSLLEITTTAVNNSKIYTIDRCGLVSRDIYARYNKDMVSDLWIRNVIRRAIIPNICRTFSSNLEASTSIIKEIIDDINESGDNIDLIDTICREIIHLFKQNFEIADYIYLKVTSGNVTNKEITRLGGSSVLNLTSNRQQDFNMCKYSLYSSINEIIEIDKFKGIKICVRTLNSIALSNAKQQPWDVINVTLDDVLLSIIEDGSEWWTCGYIDEEIGVYSKIIVDYLNILNSKEMVQVDAFFSMLAEEVNSAYIWNLILKNIDYKSAYLIQKIFPFCIAPDALLSRSLIYSICTFIENCNMYFNPKQIEDIEAAILSLENWTDGDDEWVNILKLKLLLSINEDILISDELKKIRKSIQGNEKKYENRPLLEFTPFTSNNYSDTYKGKLKRININVENNDDLIDLMENLYDINNGFSKESEEQSNENLDLIMSSVMCLHAKLLDLHIEANLEKEALKLIANGAKNALILDCMNPKLSYISNYKCILTLIINTPHFIEKELNFISLHRCYVETPKHIAAKMICVLIAFLDNDDLIDEYEILENQISGSSKCILICNIYNLYEKKQAFMWQKLMVYSTYKEFFYKESVVDCLWYLLRFNDDRVLKTLHILINNNLQDTSIINYAIGLVIYFYFNSKDELVSNIMIDISKNPVLYKWHGINGISENLFEIIRFDKLNSSNQGDITKVIQFLNGSIKNLMTIIVDLNRKLDEKASDFEVLSNELKNNYAVFDLIINNLYFKSGALKENKIEGDASLGKVYYVTIKPLIVTVLKTINESESFLISPATIHNFVQMLNYQLEFDTIEIVDFIKTLVINGKKTGYLGDPLAINEMVTFMEKLFADYKYVIQNEAVLFNVLLILDKFAEIGSDKAVSFIWRLEEIFR